MAYVEEPKKIEVPSQSASQTEAESPQQSVQKKSAKRSPVSLIKGVLILVGVGTLVYFGYNSLSYLSRLFEKLFAFTKPVAQTNVRALINEIQELQRLVALEIDHEDVVKLSIVKVGEGSFVNYVLEKGIYIYRATMSFGVDLSEMDESDIDEDNKLIHLPAVRVLDYGMTKFQVWYENYVVQPKFANLNIGWFDSKVPEEYKNALFFNLRNRVEQNLQRIADSKLREYKYLVQKTVIDMFRRLAKSFLDEDYEIRIRE